MSPRAAPKAPGANIHHSAKTDEHGTDAKVVDYARFTMGEIDFDPASSDYWNRYTVKSKSFCDQRIDALLPSTVWGAPGILRARVFENPPGTTAPTPAGTKATGVSPFVKRSVPRLFWERTLVEYFAGRILCVFWVGFSLEQLTYLQPSPVYAAEGPKRAHPLQFITNVPCERISYLQRPHTSWCKGLEVPKGKLREERCDCGRSDLGPPEEGGSPTHGSYLTFLPPLPVDSSAKRLGGEMMERFVEGAERSDMVPGALVRPHNPKRRTVG